MGESNSQENPLISPCKCTGTMMYIHLTCLQEWLKSKLTIKQQGNTVSYTWKNFECELCKEKLPSSIRMQGVRRELVEVHRPPTAYIILEDLRGERNGNHALHVISTLDNSPVRIGRGQQADLQVSNDISVSRCHALISLQGTDFYLHDNRSKFGTLILAKGPLKIEPEQGYNLQVSRTVVHVTLKQPFSFFQACFCCSGKTRVAPDDTSQPVVLQRIQQESPDHENSSEVGDSPNIPEESIH
jgi:hypothetical protein